MTNQQLAIQFFLQLAVILAACRLVGIVARRFGQLQVVAEMITGVLLGPSLFGLLLPDIQHQLFPKQGMGIIYAVSQVGLVLYMFLIGVEFNVDLIRRRIHSAAAVSLAGILTPFALGAVIAWFIVKDSTFFAAGVTSWEGMLFLGAAMSITAFPMLARIIYEHGLTGTPLGTLALAAGSIDDATAWCVLAIVLASFQGDPMIALLAIGGGVLYTLVALTLGHRLLRMISRIAEQNKGVSEWVLSLVLMLVMVAAWFTDAIGIYAVFGAFIFGVAMPKGGVLARDVTRSLESVTKNLLLPLFFVYSGLNTQIGLITTPYLWLVAIVILLAACFGKGIACWFAARVTGYNNQDAMAVGTLMNARGLMELIILNIGLERGIITPTLFAIMVIMAIVTTLMASPIFRLIYRHAYQHGAVSAVADGAA